MGLFDFIKNAGAKVLGKEHAGDVTKPLGQHLREHGIDPSTIHFKFESDGVVEMSGTVKDQETREKAVLIVGNVEGVARVDDQLRIAAADADVFSNVVAKPDTAPASPAGASGSVARASAGSDGGWSSKTYTVVSGDTLSGIAQKMYGSAGKYQQIFKANQPMLKDPDHIYPGQVLRIPPEA
jgi:nucleoid-associated protein YgaU